MQSETTFCGKLWTRGVSRVHAAHTRPAPLVRGCAQSRIHWVSFNVTRDSLLFDASSNPVVEVVSRPELATPVQPQVDLFSSASLDPAHDVRKIGIGSHHAVNMIRHQDRGAEFVLAGDLSGEQDLRDSYGDLWQTQLPGTRGNGIKQAIGHQEPGAFVGQALGYQTYRKRSSQTPRDEVRGALLLPVREFAMESWCAGMVVAIVRILSQKTRLTPRVPTPRVPTRTTHAG